MVFDQKTVILFYVTFFSLFTVTAAQQNFSNCTAKGCHLSQTKFENVHSPVEDGCTDCHETEASEHPLANEKEFVLTSQLPTLCYDCHDEYSQTENIHSPVEDGDCISCHNPHSSDNEYLLKSDQGEICAECHDDVVGEGEMIHGPVAGNMCSACHNPHQSPLPTLLEREGMDLCLYCHEDKKNVQTKPSVHEPFLEACLQCHQPHSSPYKFMVDKDVPGLCFDCHPAVAVQQGKGSEVHGPFQKDAKCYLCHNAHVSDHENLLMDKEEKLCFTCHNKKIKKAGRTVKNIEKRVYKAKFVHEPVKEDGCSACHEAHTPDNYFLLSAAFPSGSYGDGKAESFAHCFDCHDEALMTKKETVTDTNFRNGNENLHYLHVNREKARNCTTCHDIHGSKYPHIVADKVPFGKWEMPMKFKITKDGGSCQTGCHKKLGYNRNSKIENQL